MYFEQLSSVYHNLLELFWVSLQTDSAINLIVNWEHAKAHLNGRYQYRENTNRLTGSREQSNEQKKMGWMYENQQIHPTWIQRISVVDILN